MFSKPSDFVLFRPVVALTSYQLSTSGASRVGGCVIYQNLQCIKQVSEVGFLLM